jgi:hypothetical protein
MRMSGKQEGAVRRILSARRARAFVLAALVLLPATGLSAAPAPATDPSPAPGAKKNPDWWHDYQFGGFFSLSGTFAEETDGTNVKGLRFSFGPQGQVKHIVGKAETWLSFQQGNDLEKGGDLEVYGIGLQLTAIPFFRKWGGLGFLMDHGLEYRTESPHEGFGGFIGPGVEGVFWFGTHVQLTAGIEHDFGIGTRSQDLLHLGIGFGHRSWPPTLPPGVPAPTGTAPGTP